MQSLATAVDTALLPTKKLTVSYPRVAANGSGANASFSGSASTQYTISSVTVADPGVSYRIRASGQMFLTGMGASWMGSHNGGIRVGNTTLTGPAAAPDAGAVISAFVSAVNAPGGNGYLALPATTNPTVYTGTQTVYFLLALGSAGGATWGPLNSRSDYCFNVEVVPV
jgi:hypothetical protein